MSKFYIRNVLIGLAFIVVLTSAIMNASGPGGGLANAPGESSTCTSCHTSSLITSGTNWNSVRLSGNFTGNGYIPDSTYDIILSHKQTGKVKWGFQVTVLNSSNSPVGTLTAVGARNSKVTANISGQTRQYIQHTSSGTSQVGTDSVNWVFQWKAPSANVGKVTFYVVVNATNNNSSADNGDQIYAKTFEVGPSSLLPAADASIAAPPYCASTQIQFTGSGTNSPSSYSWSFPGGNPGSSTSQNPTVSYFSPGAKNAILTVRNAKGVSSPDTVKFTVASLPSASIIEGSSRSICEGDSMNLTANAGTSITYQWLHNNATTRIVSIKDTSLTYRVKVTSTTSGCSNTSGPFKLSWYPKPSISITRSINSDSVCSDQTITYTASGANIDSVIWMNNGQVVQRSQSLTYSVKATSNTTIQAYAKSANKCVTPLSNTFNLVVFEKLLPSSISFSKTTSTINLAWTNKPGISFVHYSLNKINFVSATTDSTLELTGLSPSTKYDITIRSFQPGPCGYSDTTISVTTNACSNLSFIVDYTDRVCKGTTINVRVLELFKSKYSISFNNGQFGQDTLYQFTPTQSDTLLITIIDSLSPTCPPIIEKRAFTVDMPVDTSTASTSKNVASCENSYRMDVPDGYDQYQYFKNNVLISSGPDSFYTFTGLNTGDQLSILGKSNTCSKSYGPVSFTHHPAPLATFGYARNWKMYTFTADDNTLNLYKWTINSTQVGNSASFIKDMSDYNNSNVDMKLYVETSNGCKDSSTQQVIVPNLTNIADILKGDVKVYPNPIVDQLKIQGNLQNFTIVVFNQEGKEIGRYVGEADGMVIDVSAWIQGMYHISVLTDGIEYYGGTYIKQ